MIDDTLKSIRAALYDRTSSPLFGAFSISWVIWNHRLIVVLLSSLDVKQKFTLIDTELYPNWCYDLLHLVLYPLASALAFLFIYPYPAKGIYIFWSNRQKELKVARQKIEDQTPLTVEESRQIRRQLIDLQVDYENQLNRRGEEVDRLKQGLAEAKQANDAQYGASQKDKSDIERLNSMIAVLQAQLRSEPDLPTFLSGKTFRLFFNPSQGMQGSKKMVFSEKGQIVEGRNNNEYSWRIDPKQNQLELLQSDGKVHSRFNYDPGAERPLRHTGDLDTLSGHKDQYIVVDS